VDLKRVINMMMRCTYVSLLCKGVVGFEDIGNLRCNKMFSTFNSVTYNSIII